MTKGQQLTHTPPTIWIPQFALGPDYKDAQYQWQRHPLRNVVWASRPPEGGKMKGQLPT